MASLDPDPLQVPEEPMAPNDPRRVWVRWPTVETIMRRQRRIGLLEGLGIGIVAGLAAGLLISPSVRAAPRPAPDPSPVPADQGRTEAPAGPGVSVPSLQVRTAASEQPAVAPVSPDPSPTSTVRTPPASETQPRPAHRLLVAASWYCLPGRSGCTSGFAARGAYGAAGPALRRALGPSWRGRVVWIRNRAVRLIDWCACPGGRLVDLYAGVFDDLAPLSRGVVRVEVRW